MKVTVDLMGQQYCSLGKHLQTEKCYKGSQKKKTLENTMEVYWGR